MSASVPIVRYGTCFLAEEGATVVGELSWEQFADRWHVHMIESKRPYMLVELCAQFRRIWREGGRLPVTFEAHADNVRMQRLMRLFGIPLGDGRYRIEDVDTVGRRRPRGAAGVNNHGKSRSLDRKE